jgi:hypothetical protein
VNIDMLWRRTASAQLLAFAVLATAPVASNPGFFAKDAIPLSDGQMHSINGNGVGVSATRIEDDSTEGAPAILGVKVGQRRFDRRFNFGVNAEVLWSPDARRFAVTGSREGANGQYRLAVADIADGLKWFEVTSAVERAFGHPVRCGWPEVPNVAAVTWLSPARVVVAAQIIDHSNCDSFGTFVAYEFDVDTQRLGPPIDQLEAKRRWSPRLGIALSTARDACIRNPTACHVPANHPARRK